MWLLWCVILDVQLLWRMMKMNRNRVYAVGRNVVVVLLVMLIAVSGCVNDSAGGDPEEDGPAEGAVAQPSDGIEISRDPSEYVYLAEDVSFPDDLGNMLGFTYYDGKVFFAADNESKEYLYYNSSAVSLYSIKIDGTGLTKLSGYSPFAVKSEDAGSGVSVVLSADNEGNLWVIELWTFYDFNLPEDFDNDNDNPWDYSAVTDESYIARKLDGNGAELFHLDLGSLRERWEYFGIMSFAIDSSDNIYIAAQTEEAGKIFVLNTEGEMFELSADGFFHRFITLQDGTVAFPELSGNLQLINPAAKDFGEKIIIPAAEASWSNAQFYSGGEYGILINDGSSLYSFIPGNDEPVKLLNWIESNVVVAAVQDIIALPDGRIFCVNAAFRTSLVLEPFILTRVLRAELPEKTVITLATYGLFNDFDNAVIAFNKRSNEYRIEVKDYLDDAMNIGGADFMRLTTEILAGEVFDILGIQGMPYMTFMEKELLTDLYPFIDADAELSRGDFVQPALKAAEVDGGLYQFFPSFFVDTLIGSEAVVGADMGWGIDEFASVLDAHPDADMPIGWMTGIELLKRVINYNMDAYIDWETGTSNFDTPEFIELLRLCSRLPVNIYNIVPRETLLSSGRQIIGMHYASQMGSLHVERLDFGGDIVFKGYPSVPENGSVINTWESFAISENSPNKDAAWEFLRMLLSKDWQLDRRIGGMPTNQAAFDYNMNNVLNYDYSGWSMERDGVSITLTQEQVKADVEMILELIDSAGSGIVNISDGALLNIITKDAMDFFNGLNSAEDAARNIQNRVSIYVAEQG